MVKKKDIEEPKFEEASGEMMLEETSNTDVMLEEKASSTVMLEEKASKEPLLEESTKAEKPTSKKAVAPAKPAPAKTKKPATKPTSSSPNAKITDKEIWEKIKELRELEERINNSRSTSTGNRTAATKTSKQEASSNRDKQEKEDYPFSDGDVYISMLIGVVCAIWLSFFFFSSMGGWGILLAIIIGIVEFIAALTALAKHKKQWKKILCWSSFIIVSVGLIAFFVIHGNMNINVILGSIFLALFVAGLLRLIVDYKEFK